MLIGLLIGIGILFVICILIMTIIRTPNWIEVLKGVPPEAIIRSDAGTVISPLWEDVSIGEWKTVIRLGTPQQSQVFECIVDTGSSNLVVFGPECAQCPKGKGTWNSSLGTLVSPSIRKVDYVGSQSSRYRMWQTQLPDLDYRSVEVGVAIDSSINGGRPENVMGLQKNGFLRSIGNVLLDFPRKTFALGRITPGEGASVPLINTDLVKYPLSPVASLTIDGVVKSNLIDMVLWDTGSTISYVDPSVHDVLNGSTFEITFSNGVVIKYNSKPYDLGPRQLPIPRTLLIGNQWMKQHGYAFLFSEDRVVIIP